MMPGKPLYINAGGKLLDLTIPKVMGIINITPDSFYKGSRILDNDDLVIVAGRMIGEGADILDIGGQSTRPGSEVVKPDEEKTRVLNAIRTIRTEFPDIVISIDTFRAEIAYEAVTKYNVQIINDIYGGEGDINMFKVIAELNVPYIMMHMKGTPATMQNNPVYEDVVADILKWFSPRIEKLQSVGVKDIILDPGFGFGKTIDHNFEMLRRLEEFSIAGLPVLAGLSRKSLIWKTLSLTADEALNGTSVLNAIALMNGADILRVHDVKEAVEVVKLSDRLMRGAEKN